jgi:hypothetical protein
MFSDLYKNDTNVNTCNNYDETARDRNYSLPGRFRLIQVLEIEILRTPDPQTCKVFPIKAGFNYAEVPVKTSFLVCLF